MQAPTSWADYNGFVINRQPGFEINMANRLTKIYTRTGDMGETSRADGVRIAKDDILMHVQGEVDELNCVLGMLVSKLFDDEDVHMIQQIQNDLFDIGAEISLSRRILDKDKITRLEQRLDDINHDLPALKEFVLPGGGEAASICHLARAVCRRAERHLVTLNREQKNFDTVLAYINRLSDLLFVFARHLTRLEDDDETMWELGH